MVSFSAFRAISLFTRVLVTHMVVCLQEVTFLRRNRVSRLRTFVALLSRLWQRPCAKKRNFMSLAVARRVCEEWVGSDIASLAGKDVKKGLILLLDQATGDYDEASFTKDIRLTKTGYKISPELLHRIKEGPMSSAKSTTYTDIIAAAVSGSVASTTSTTSATDTDPPAAASTSGSQSVLQTSAESPQGYFRRVIYRGDGKIVWDKTVPIKNGAVAY